jgi:hypothetical protein
VTCGSGTNLNNRPICDVAISPTDLSVIWPSDQLTYLRYGHLPN